MLPLQCLAEALAELCLDEAQEGRRESGLAIGLGVELQANTRYLSNKGNHIKLDHMPDHVPKEHSAYHCPRLNLGCRLVPACHRGDILFFYQQTCVRKLGQSVSTVDGVPLTGQ